VIFTYGILSKLVLTYFPQYALRPESLNWDSQTVGRALLVFGLGRTLYFILGRYLRNSFRTIIVSLGIDVILLFCMIWLTNPVLIFIVLFISGIMIGRIYLNSLAILLHHEQKQKGAKAGLFESFIGFGSSISPVLAGALAEYTYWLPFLGFAIIGVIFLIVLFRFKRTIKIPL
jgi:MFS family permease